MPSNQVRADPVKGYIGERLNANFSKSRPLCNQIGDFGELVFAVWLTQPLRTFMNKNFTLATLAISIALVAGAAQAMDPMTPTKTMAPANTMAPASAMGTSNAMSGGSMTAMHKPMKHKKKPMAATNTMTPTGTMAPANTMAPAKPMPPTNSMAPANAMGGSTH